MAAIARQQRSLNLAPLLALILAATLMGAMGRVLLSSHATDRHGVDARLTRQCIERNGAAEKWQRLNDDGIEYWLCQLRDGRWCMMIAQVWPSRIDNATHRERSSFCPGDGSYRKVMKYLEKFARRIS